MKHKELVIVLIFAVGIIALNLSDVGASIPPTRAFSKIVIGNQTFVAESYNAELDLTSFFDLGGPVVQLPYAQLSSSQTQPVAAAGAASNITLNTNNGIYGISHSTTIRNHEIVIQEDGIYFIMAGAQIGRSASIPAGVHNLWLAKNNVNIDGTNIKTAIPAITPNTLVGITNWVGHLEQGDIITIMQSSPDTTDIQLEATPAAIPPDTPAIIVTIFKRVGV